MDDPSPSHAELLDRTHRLAGRLREQRRTGRLSTRERDQAIAELRAAGMSVRQIARAAGISRTQVYRVLAEWAPAPWPLATRPPASDK